jgi:hypothetical protein
MGHFLKGGRGGIEWRLPIQWKKIPALPEKREVLYIIYGG